MHRAGYEVTVICPRGPFAEAAYESIDGIEVYRHPLPLEARGKLGYLAEYSSALWWEFAYSLKVFWSRGFDVLHACNPPDLIFLVGAFYKYLFGTKFVFDHHDLNPELFEAKFGHRGLLWKALVFLERMTFSVADISIATNRSYADVAIHRGRMTPDRVFVVRSGPNLARVRELAPDHTWRNGRSHLVAYVGVIGEQEGIDLLLEAVRHITSARRRADIQFVIMGAGPSLEQLKQTCARMHLAEFVTFTGRIDDTTLFKVLSTADVCVNPDRPNAMNDMSTMNKIMEYMALGKPIVQFDLAEGRVSALSASLYARNTDTTDFGDKILELIDDPSRRRDMGLYGQKRVRDELSWEHEEPKLMAAYEAVFNRASRARNDRNSARQPWQVK
ncbi:Glycosyltransferase involved in cell wall bisynthesis [Bradyrhizobium shewense]|uniref:Glycosyltransferase involved in cell wall bisynthesis n=1 Tax=Bradyrhizobium shewense TaxID=1761772 RepID=A0A1C3TYU9_9BRAD|nr:Glycosyltransferase involved in cell wall bisynthesis [Bradyrhizobium shewense]